MTNREDAVSEAIGGVLLIALVLIGAAIVGTWVASQALPEKIPKVQFNIKDVDLDGDGDGDRIILEHQGGESLKQGTFHVLIDGARRAWNSDCIIEPDDATWSMGDRIVIDNYVGDRESVGLAYSDGSGETLLRSSSSSDGFVIPEFPLYDPAEVVDLPDRLLPADPYTGPLPDHDWPGGFEPQPTFTPAPGSQHVYVAAEDSTVVPPVPPLFVCDGTDDERQINDALGISPGVTVELLDGTFHCSGRIIMREHTTLIGQGSDADADGLITTIEMIADEGQSGYLPIAVGAEYVNLGGIIGGQRKGFSIRGNAFVMITRSNVRVQDIYASSVDLSGVRHKASGNGMFFVWVADPVTEIDNVEFYQCEANQCSTHGYNMNQDYNDRICRATTNIRFVECWAIQCGYGLAGDPVFDSPGETVDADEASRSEWITGFDFHEWQDLVNLEVVGCVAEDNWESGFHLEPGARYGANGENIGPRTVSQNIVFRDCVSSTNGRRNTHDGRFFMSGYYLSRDTQLINCRSFNNLNAGYYVHSGENCEFIGCQDEGSIYGWKVCKASSYIALDNCLSRANHRWALWLSFSDHITVTNFQHTNVVGDRGYQSILGWYKDESKYQQPVTSSEFHITAIGNGMPIINRAGSGNEYFLTYG